jgi:hypothetical protein
MVGLNVMVEAVEERWKIACLVQPCIGTYPQITNQNQ